MKIGIFDSGIGGLSVLHEAYHRLPGQEYIFYADTDHVPYGTKTPEQIVEFAIENVRFLIDKGAEALVVACNTATSVAIKELRSRFEIPILGMEPAVKPAVEGTDDKRIMVIATPVTIREDKLKDLLHRVDEEHRVDLMAMPRLVEFAEKEQFDTEEVVGYIRGRFANFGKDTLLVDGNYGTVHHLADVLGLKMNSDQDTEVYFDDYHKMLDEYKTEYYFSKNFISDVNTLEHLKRLHNRLEEVRKI